METQHTPSVQTSTDYRDSAHTFSTNQYTLWRLSAHLQYKPVHTMETQRTPSVQTSTHYGDSAHTFSTDQYTQWRLSTHPQYRPVHTMGTEHTRSLVLLDHIARTMYIEAVYCYRLSSVVCPSVGRSVCHTSKPCKNS